MIFSRSPVGQEEKQGKARFPLAILSAALHPANTLPCGTAKARTRGTGRTGQSTKKESIPQKTHTRQNNTIGCTKTRKKNVMRITKRIKECVQFGNQIKKRLSLQ